MTESKLDPTDLVVSYGEKRGTRRPLHPSLTNSTNFELTHRWELEGKLSIEGGGESLESHPTTTPPPMGTLPHLRPTVTTLPIVTTSTTSPPPLGLVITPLLSPSDQEIPVVTSPPLHCRPCRAYLSPHSTLLPHLDRWRCALCHALNSIPSYHPLSNPTPGDPSTDRITALERLPEFQTTTVDYLASTRLDLTPPTYLFLIELTDLSQENEVTKSCLLALRTALDQLATSSRPGRPFRVGFIIVSPHELHCYRFRGRTRGPELLMIRDLDEEGEDLPHPELLTDLREVQNQVDVFLRRLSERVRLEVPDRRDGSGESIALGPALRLAKRILTRAGHGGQILLFHASSPTIPKHPTSTREGLARLKGGEGWYRMASGGAGQTYKNFALECNQARIGITLFSFGLRDLALASLMALPRFTGGQLYHYPDFTTADPQQMGKLEYEVSEYLATDFVRDVTAVLRCHPQIRVTNYYGHQYLHASQTISLPYATPHICYTVEFAIDGKVSNPAMGFQSAVAYTDHHGQKYVRVTTMLVPTTTEDWAELHPPIDPVAVVTFLTKRAVDRSLTTDLTEVRRALTDQTQRLPQVAPLISAALHHVALQSDPIIPLDRRLGAGYTLLAATPTTLYAHLGLPPSSPLI